MKESISPLYIGLVLSAVIIYDARAKSHDIKHSCDQVLL